MEKTYIPRYHLYPTNSQILHQLMLELFIRCPQYETAEEPFFSMVPVWPVYKYGWALANHRKQIFQSHPAYETLVVVSFADLPPDVAGISTTDEQLHTFFGTIKLARENVWGFLQSAEMFAMYAKWIEAQLPFIRAYKHLDNVAAYIVNIAKDDIVLSDVLDTVTSFHGDKACYVFVQPETWAERVAQLIEER